MLLACFTSIYRDVQECLRRCGYGIVNRVMYGDDAPLFQLDTVHEAFDIFSLKKLIAQLPKTDKQLETALRGKAASSKRKVNMIKCITFQQSCQI